MLLLYCLDMSTLAVTFIVLYSMAIIVVLESSGMFLPKRVSNKTENFYHKRENYNNQNFRCLHTLILERESWWKPNQKNVPSAMHSLVSCSQPFENTREKKMWFFSGCGRKRSNLPALSPDGQEVENAIDGLLELSEEPSIEDLSRQIMSEAKLWEAIQEAKMELDKQKHLPRLKQPKFNNDEGTLAHPVRNSVASCDMPPCYSTL